MRPSEYNTKLIEVMIEDMGIGSVIFYNDEIPNWLVEICDRLIQKGWTKKENT